jgi:hypothetical protein
MRMGKSIGIKKVDEERRKHQKGANLHQLLVQTELDY